MKKTLLLICSLAIATLMQALTINNTAGGLFTAVGAELTTCTSLTVTGNIDARDFKTMKSSMTALTTIDLSGATVVAYTGTAGTASTASTTYAANTLPAKAFSNKSKLTSIAIPSSVTSIGDEAFYSCSKLTSVTIPSSVTSIGDYEFNGCRALTSIIIPSSVTSIGSNAFLDCICFITVDVNNSNYSSLDGVLYNKTKTTLIQCPIFITGLFTIPSSVTSIGDYAFSGCKGLSSVIIPSSVTSIGSGTFAMCSALITVDLSNSNYSSLDGVLYNKSKTTLIQYPSSKTGLFTIPSSVTSIENGAFYDCSGLTSVIIHSSVTSIGNAAFCFCSGLTSIKVLTSIPSNINLETMVFESVNTTTCKLYVPTGSKSAYQIADQWKDFTKIEEFNPNVIYTPEVGNFNISITSNLLTITNAPQGESVMVYNINGSVISTQKANGSDMEVALPAHGVYIVKVGAVSEKVVY